MRRDDEWISHQREQSWADFTPGPITTITTQQGEPDLRMLRLDLLRSWASGNKYYKLKYAIQYAITHGIRTIVSKGGMFSNHLLALAEACAAFNIQLVALIRSHAPDEANPAIGTLRSYHTQIIYLPPSRYKIFNEADAKRDFPSALFIPEGGLSEVGIRGTSEIMRECNAYNPSHIIVAGGSLGTASGLVSSAPSSVKVVIVPAWKGCTGAYFDDILKTHHVQPSCAWELWHEYHFGGFGKFNQQLIDFMMSFSADTGIPLDPVYTGKVMFAVYDKLKSGYFTRNDTPLVLHTGGLQGLSGYRYRFPEEWGGYCQRFMT